MINNNPKSQIMYKVFGNIVQGAPVTVLPANWGSGNIKAPELKPQSIAKSTVIPVVNYKPIELSKTTWVLQTGKISQNSFMISVKNKSYRAYMLNGQIISDIPVADGIAVGDIATGKSGGCACAGTFSIKCTAGE